MALVDLTSLKARLGITVTTYDDALDAIISGASSLVRSYLGWNPEVTGDQTEYLAPNSDGLLSLRKAAPDVPVTVTAVYEDTSREFAAETLLEEGVDYVQDPPSARSLVRLGRNWPGEVRRMPNRLAGVMVPYTQAVKVVYTLDTTDALNAARQACLIECMAQYNRQFKGMGVGLVTSDSMDGASVTINTTAKQTGAKADSGDGFAAPGAAGMLRPYRMIALA
jgi:hypothetical protein